MTIGIYALYWEEQDLIYIGKSVDTKKRFQEHIRDLKNKAHSNYKVQSTYNIYGSPKFIVIEETIIAYLDEREIFWTEEFNSIETGLNIVAAGNSGTGYGTLHGRSKYTKLEVLKVFHDMYLYTSMSLQDIANKYQVNHSLPEHISNSTAHLWLKDKYPKHWNIIQNNRKLRNALSLGNKREVKLLSPNNEVIIVTSIKEFSKKYNIISPPAISLLINKKKASYKGWTLYTRM